MDVEQKGVVVCREPLAARAGGRMLEEGGNAFDAAVAAAFAQSVVNPVACGIGGTAKMNLYSAAGGTYLTVGGLGGAGSRAVPDQFTVLGETNRPNRWHVADHANCIGYLAPVVPTFVKVMGETHRLFGRLPWEEVLRPAIELATDGFVVWPELARGWDPHAKGATDFPSGHTTLGTFAETRKIYLKDGEFYKVGETLKQTDMGATIKRIAREGPSEFYVGETGRAMADDFARNGGLITEKDLRSCFATVYKPLRGTYRGHTLHGTGEYRIEMFNLIEEMDVRSLTHNSAEYLDALALCFQAAHVDRARYMGDARFVDTPTQELISKDRARRIVREIQAGTWWDGMEQGHFPSFSTTGLVVMDAEGNTVAMSHSNGSSSGVVTQGLGFLYNNHMHNFNPLPGRRNSIAPGKEPHSAAGGPLIVSDDEGPIMALAHYSRAGTTSEVQIVLNVLDHGLDVQAAVEAPRIHAEYEYLTIYVDPSFPESIREELVTGTRHKLKVGAITPAVATIHKDRSTNSIRGGGDPRAAYGVVTV